MHYDSSPDEDLLVAALANEGHSETDRGTLSAELANFLLALGEPQQAIEHYKRAAEQFERSGRTVLVWMCHAAAASAQGEAGDPNLAIVQLLEMARDCPIESVRVSLAVSFAKNVFLLVNSGREPEPEIIHDLRGRLAEAINSDHLDLENQGRAVFQLTQLEYCADNIPVARDAAAQARLRFVRANSPLISQLDLLEQQRAERQC